MLLVFTKDSLGIRFQDAGKHRLWIEIGRKFPFEAFHPSGRFNLNRLSLRIRS